MKFSAFRGGVHPDGFKELSSTQLISKLPLPEILYVPLRQHAGSEAVPVVRKGEQVFKGQLIGRAGQGLSAPIHAPTSGTVTEIKPVIAAHPSGCEANSIHIVPDGEDLPRPSERIDEPFNTDRDMLAKRISVSGIVGMGGAAFPSAVKLNSASGRGIHTLLINGGECEPYLTADDRLMRERSEGIVTGARIIAYIIDAPKVIIAIEDNKTDAIAAIQATVAGYDHVDVCVVPTRYPMGSAKQMIQAVTGREVPAGGRSSDVGVLMHNVATAYAIYRCIVHNEPLTSRIVTVSGGAVHSPGNVEALIGTPMADLIAHCGGTIGEPERLLLGGPMMGHIIHSDRVPLIKGAAGILALTKKELAKTSESPCIRCSRCVDACPMGLVPLEMANHSRHMDFEGANEYGLKDCILCGSCAYVCPSHIPLVHYFQFAKGELNIQKQAEKRSDYTRELAEARRVRQEREAAEKAAAKAAKAEAKKKAAAAKAAKAAKAKAAKEAKQAQTAAADSTTAASE